MKYEVSKKIKASGVVAVIRAESAEKAIRISKACFDGGIIALEITFTVPDAAHVIKTLSLDPHLKGVLLGAGTVLDAKTAIEAIQAGAQYIVSPGYDQKTLEACIKYDIPYMPGCLSITEMMTALAAGVDIIKLFPGSAFGPDYIKAIKGPLPHIHIMPTGGVNLENVQTWIKNGVVAVGVGGELTGPAKNDDYQSVTKNAQAFIQAVKEARQT